MTYTVYFIVTLIAVSGLIAYLGDLLGRRMGKRRLILFGLRPRYTAIVMTTITGMLIAMLTIGTLLGVSKNLRDILMRGAQLIQDYQVKNSDLQAQNKNLTAASTELTREMQQKTVEVTKARKDVEKAKKDAEAALKARNEVRLRVENLQKEIAARQAELSDLKAAGKLTKERLAQISADLNIRKEELASVRIDLARKDTELAEKQKDLTSKTDELTRKQDELLQKELSIAKSEEQIKRQQETILAQGQRLMEATQIRDMLLTGSVLLPFGQEVGRKVIDASQPIDDVKSELRALLENTNSVELRLHSELGDGKRAIQLVLIDNERRMILYPKDDNTVIDAAAKAIVDQGRRDSTKGVIACLIVVSNTLRGEVAPVEFNLALNNLAFKRGERIASKIIDGRLSEGRILLAVNDFLGDDVRLAAANAGVLPVATPDPSQADEQMSGTQIDELMELVEKIRSQHALIELNARAKKDIYAVGPLNMDNIQFSISELMGSSR